MLSQSKKETIVIIIILFIALTAGEQIFKRPARDACLCMGELPAPPAPAAPPAPYFVFLITL